MMRGSTNNLKKAMAKVRNQRKRILNSDMPADLKREEVDMLDAYMNSMLRDVVPYLKEEADLPFYNTLYRK